MLVLATNPLKPLINFFEAIIKFFHDTVGLEWGLCIVVLTLLMSTTTDRTQRLIFIALPFLFVAFAVRFPAGLLVYWITTNFWTIVQQTIVRRRLGPLRPPDPLTAAAAAAGGDGTVT